MVELAYVIRDWRACCISHRPAEWHEFQNSEKVEPAYKNLLTRHSPERMSKSFPNFNPVFDRIPSPSEQRG